MQDLDGGKPAPLPADGMIVQTISPDGKRFTAFGPGGEYYLGAIGAEQSVPIPGIKTGETPVQWSADSRSLFMRSPGDLTIQLDRLDLASGRREPWKQLAPQGYIWSKD